MINEETIVGSIPLVTFACSVLNRPDQEMAPSINSDGLSRSERGVAGCKKCNHPGNFISRAGPSHGMSRLGVLHELERDTLEWK